VRSWTDNVTSTLVNRTNHYSDPSDNPAWTQDGSVNYTRPAAGVGGLTGIFDSASGTTDYQIANLHGDIVATIRGAAVGLSATTPQIDEYGAPPNPAQAGTTRYRWLGQSERAADTPSGITEHIA
jgi:hypothetical protein